LDEVRNDLKAGLETGLEEVKKVNTAEVKALRDQINEVKEILSAVFKDKLPAINSK
jgi:archaellum component FlaC